MYAAARGAAGARGCDVSAGIGTGSARARETGCRRPPPASRLSARHVLLWLLGAVAVSGVLVHRPYTQPAPTRQPSINAACPAPSLTPVPPATAAAAPPAAAPAPARTLPCVLRLPSRRRTPIAPAPAPALRCAPRCVVADRTRSTTRRPSSPVLARCPPQRTAAPHCS